MNDTTRYTELTEKLEAAQAAIRDIKAQLDDPEMARGRGPEWKGKASAALRHYQREVDHLQAELGADKRQQNSDLKSRFIDVARRRLDQTLFDDLMAEAREEAAA